VLNNNNNYDNERITKSKTDDGNITCCNAFIGIYMYYVYSERRVYYVPLDVFNDKLRILAYRDRIGHRKQRNNIKQCSCLRSQYVV